MRVRAGVWLGAALLALSLGAPVAAQEVTEGAALAPVTDAVVPLPEPAEDAVVEEPDDPAEPPPMPVAVLVLDVEQAYDASAWGKRSQEQLKTAAREIEAENKRLEAQLTAEEQALSAERPTLDPAAFRKKAEAFDARAQQVRRDRAEAVRALNARADADRSAFLEASLPVVTALMQERDAAIVLDRRQTLLAISTADITAELVRRMDETLGEGGPLPELPGDAATATGAAAETPAPVRDASPSEPEDQARTTP
ncbi:OmpH family outer membrane protein [Paracoccus jeotgali]|uniref:Molecular chaperone Skp n=1 Tax=Paracoccus jeotgali TaxID=2065379 RepID=A0A2K9MFU1_9RHOB|nr:OmpH family outer membrane protein [Paracoccus jeotgali]AUM73896.1 molecular chaperone Skp [Paracoccus jeotgali]